MKKDRDRARSFAQNYSFNKYKPRYEIFVYQQKHSFRFL